MVKYMYLCVIKIIDKKILGGNRMDKNKMMNMGFGTKTIHAGHHKDPFYTYIPNVYICI